MQASVHLWDRNVNLVVEGIYVAVRIGALPDAGLIARKLGAVLRMPVAAPGYLDRVGGPAALWSRWCRISPPPHCPCIWSGSNPTYRFLPLKQVAWLIPFLATIDSLYRLLHAPTAANLHDRRAFLALLKNKRLLRLR